MTSIEDRTARNRMSHARKIISQLTWNLPCGSLSGNSTATLTESTGGLRQSEQVSAGRLLILPMLAAKRFGSCRIDAGPASWDCYVRTHENIASLESLLL